jgi:hypothetical protein
MARSIELEGFEIELASELYCDRGGDWATTSMNRRVMCAVHESNRAESVMSGRLVAEPWSSNPGTGVRIAPRQPV